MRGTLAIAGALLLAIAPHRPARAEVPPGFTLSTWAFVQSTATSMAWAPDGSNRLFVTTQDGVVTVLHYVGSIYWERQPVQFALIDPIYASGECGLDGLAFDPAFQSNHYVYFFVTVSAHEQQIIRYTDSGDVGTNKTVIVSGLPTVGDRHNGGALGVGPDGKLYFGVGDNAKGRGVNSDLGSLAAKIGRTNLDGSVPNDNPFFDGDGPNADAIWARGMRNPFTLAFQPETGALWVNVVGERYEQAFVVQRGDHAGYIDYENDQPQGYITPIIKYRTNGQDTLALTADGAVRSGSVSTFTTTSVHGFRIGEKITISGVTDASFDGDVYVASVPTPTTFSCVQAGSDSLSGGGMAATQSFGSCITGGAFYDATQFPFEYRGNFLFGDWTQNTYVRAVLASPTEVARTDRWGMEGQQGLVDFEVGPDGALYMLRTTGEVTRTAYQADTQKLVVSDLHEWMVQGSERSFSVSLAMQPSTAVTVQVAITGDPHLTVGPAALSFTPDNWNVPQPFTITAGEHSGATLDTAAIELSSSGLTTETVQVRSVGRAQNELVLSAGALVMDEGASTHFSVALLHAPAADVTVTVARTSGNASVEVTAGASLTFTPANYGTPREVTLAANDDAISIAEPATIELTATGLPPRIVTVSVNDDDPRAPKITSLPDAVAFEGVPYEYRVQVSGIPAPTFTLIDGPAGMTIDPSTGLIQWQPVWTSLWQIPVVVSASNGLAPDAVQSYVLELSIKGPPECWINDPTPDSIVVGEQPVIAWGINEEPGQDIEKLDFFVDDTLIYTGEGPQGGFRLGGVRGLWDSTQVSNGPHVIKVRATDVFGQTCEAWVDIQVQNTSGSSMDAGADAGVDGGEDSGIDAGLIDGGSTSTADGSASDTEPNPPDAGPTSDAVPPSSAERAGAGASSAMDAGRDAAPAMTMDTGGNASLSHDPSDKTPQLEEHDAGRRHHGARIAADPSGCSCRIAYLASARPGSTSAWLLGMLLATAKRLWPGRRRRRRQLRCYLPQKSDS